MRWVVVLLCACNQVYGLEDTTAREGLDSDGDSVGNADDNCVLVANADQSDADADYLGDACDPCVAGPQLLVDDDDDSVDDGCDPCLTGANTDEDGDGALDGCDVCPGDIDDGRDEDGDGVGDACDHAPGVANTRVMFDGFAPVGDGWVTGFTEWRAVDGNFMPLPPISYQYRGAWHPAGMLSLEGWSIRARLRLPPPAERMTSGRIGVEAISPGGGSSLRACALRHDGSGWILVQNSQPVVPAERILVELRERLTPGVTSECFIDGELQSSRAFNGTLADQVPMLLTAAGVEYKWIEIIH